MQEREALVQLKIRIPIELRTWLKAASVQNRRSESAELIVRLQNSRAAENAAQ